MLFRSRYLDVDGDGIPYRTIPGTRPTKGSFFTRGSSRDEYARYTEDGATYVRNMDRLLKKWETAKSIVPAPEMYQDQNSHSIGIMFYGTTAYPALETIDMLNDEGVMVDAMRIRAFPFNNDVQRFIDEHDVVYVIEQNRDAQLRTLLMVECDADPKKLRKVLNYDGMPITAVAIAAAIKADQTVEHKA